MDLAGELSRLAGEYLPVASPSGQRNGGGGGPRSRRCLAARSDHRARARRAPLSSAVAQWPPRCGEPSNGGASRPVSPAWDGAGNSGECRRSRPMRAKHRGLSPIRTATSSRYGPAASVLCAAGGPAAEVGNVIPCDRTAQEGGGHTAVQRDNQTETDLAMARRSAEPSPRSDSIAVDLVERGSGTVLESPIRAVRARIR